MTNSFSFRALAAAAAVAVTFAVAAPAAVAQALPCEGDKGCRSGQPFRSPEWHMGWILYADGSTGSYWTYALYQENSHGQCFDFHDVGVGCPD